MDGKAGGERERESERARARKLRERERERESEREERKRVGGGERRGGRRGKEAIPLVQREAVAGREVKIDRGAWGV